MSAHSSELAVFLCHGAGGDGGSCAALASALEARAGVSAHAVTYPGRADVPGPPRRSVAELAEFLRAHVAAQLGSLDAPHAVLGHSMGGALALEYALTAPPGLRALALVSTGARLRVHPSILAALSPDGDSPGPGPAGDAFARSIEAAARTPRASALADWQAANAFDRMADVHQVRTPTLILVGEADLLTPLKYARFLHERIAGSQLVVLPGAGHGLPTEHTLPVAEHVAAFLRALARPEARS